MRASLEHSRVSVSRTAHSRMGTRKLSTAACRSSSRDQTTVVENPERQISQWSPRAAECSISTTSIPPWTRLVLTSPGSEEHTSELQSLRHLVCRLLLENK